MKPFAILCILALLGALAAPFFLTVNGKPVLTIDKVVDDATPDALTTPTEVYRWQDANGQWHFGEAPPEGQSAEQVALEERITGLDAGWHVKPLDSDKPKPEVGMTAPGVAGYVEAGQKLMNQAAVQVDTINQRTAEMEALRQRLD